MLEWEFDVAIEGKNVQHVIKHKNKGWSLISEPWGKNVIMQKFRGKIIILKKLESRAVLINVSIKWVKFAILDQEERKSRLDKGNNKVED